MSPAARHLRRLTVAPLTGAAGTVRQRWYNAVVRAGRRRSSSRGCSGVRTRIAHMRLLLVALLLGSLLQIAQVPATAAPAEQTPSAQMTVRAGFDGLGKV